MSKDLVNDIKKMHAKFGVTEAMGKLSKAKRAEFLKFRVGFLEEELTELKENSNNPEEVVDALIDLTVVAITTLDALGVDTNKAWNEVQKANMAKEPGINPNRPNPLGLPDMVKPEGWKAPSHEGNHGNIVGYAPTVAPTVAAADNLDSQVITISASDESQESWPFPTAPEPVVQPKSKWVYVATAFDIVAYTGLGILIATNIGPIVSFFA
jgi:predicted HAD superfamily Cof-like phosphohydrolase